MAPSRVGGSSAVGPELARLDVAFRAAADGNPRVVVVGGEAGVGKTRLAAEFLHRAADRGAATLTGRCPELVEASLPYAPFVEALRRLAQQLEEDERTSRSRAAGASSPSATTVAPRARR